MSSTSERIPLSKIASITFDHDAMVISRILSPTEVEMKKRARTWFQSDMKHNLIDASGPWHNYDASKRASMSGMSVNYEGAEIEWIDASESVKDGFVSAITSGIPASEIFPAIKEGLKDTTLSQSGTPWLPLYIDHLKTVYNETLQEIEESS